MKTLKSLCVSVIKEWIFQILLQRKESIALNWGAAPLYDTHLPRYIKTTGWTFVNISEWIQAMKLEDIHKFLMNFCIASTFDILLSESEEKFKEAGNHDLLVCCYFLFLNEFTIKITIPTCLKMDMAHRIYLLKRLYKYTKVRNLDFQCYSGGQNVSEKELNLVRESLNTFKDLTLLKLPSVATNDIIQSVISNCDKLMVLNISFSTSVTDLSVFIITKTHQLIKKGSLTKLKAIQNSKPSELKLLDVSKTSITPTGNSMLLEILPNCKIVQSKYML